jgi:hypothetical protein
MSTFTEEIIIKQPVETLWEALADIGSISRWNPGVSESYVISDRPTGLGAARHCNLGGTNYLKEQAVTWEKNRKLTMRITDTNLPFKSADIQFLLSPETGGTRVILTPIYRLKYGLLGSVLDRVYVKNTYRKGMRALLRGLREYLESGA